jgi:hypothetical protein
MTQRFSNFSELDHYLHAVDWMLRNRFKCGRSKKYRMLVKYRGGKCSICGSIFRLEFHHNDGNKEMDVWKGRTMAEMKAEAKKCILVCKECHDRLDLGY